MAKYLHKFASLEDFKTAYEGADYLEPWVSYTVYDKTIGFTATPSGGYGSGNTYNYTLYAEVDNIEPAY